MKEKNRRTTTEPTGLGVYIHVNISAPTEPQHRPPPASRLPSWVIGTVESELIGATCPHGRTTGHAVGGTTTGAYRGEWCGPSPKLPDE